MDMGLLIISISMFLLWTVVLMQSSELKKQQNDLLTIVRSVKVLAHSMLTQYDDTTKTSERKV